jgi:hypothetical protein
MRTIFHKLNDACAKYNSQTEHLPTYEIIVLFEAHVIFKYHIPRKCKRFVIKIYILCNSKGYTFNMSAYLGRDRKHATDTVITT